MSSSLFNPLLTVLPNGEGLINIKKKNQKNFLWCHVRHITPSKEHPERIKKKKNDKKLVKHITNPEKIRDEDKEFNNDLYYNEIEFIVLEKDFSKIKVKNNISINCLVMKMAWVFKIYISDQKFGDSMDLFHLIDDDKSHYVYIKNFDRFMFHKTKNKNKKLFCRSCLQCFSRESVSIKHKEIFLSINDK